MSAGKWQKRYDNQVDANNLLSDRLRRTREGVRQALDQARKLVTLLQESRKTAHDHLMDAQPHIALLTEQERVMIDAHVDQAMEALSDEDTK